MPGNRTALHQEVEGNKGVTTVPDVAKASASVKVYLPKGSQWIDFWTNETIAGGQEIQRECPVDILPLTSRREVSFRSVRKYSTLLKRNGITWTSVFTREPMANSCSTKTSLITITTKRVCSPPSSSAGTTPHAH